MPDQFALHFRVGVRDRRLASLIEYLRNSWTRVPADLGKLLHSSGIPVGTINAWLLHPEVKRGPLDSQACGLTVGAGDHPSGLFESLENVVALRVRPG
jgi:hypothetical protein